jgi:excisionase family DNA binding protein
LLRREGYHEVPSEPSGVRKKKIRLLAGPRCLFGGPRLASLSFEEPMAKQELNHVPFEGNRLQRETAGRRLLDALTSYVETFVDDVKREDDWVSQSNSPLGRRRHLELVRKGQLPAARSGRKVLVRKRDIDALLAVEEAAPDVNATVERNTAALISSLGLQYRR